MSGYASSLASNHNSALVAAADWLPSVLLGTLGVSIAVLAIAVVGFGMLSGRIAARSAMRVVIGCFILFGASAIAKGLMGGVLETRASADVGAVAVPPPAPLPKYSPPPPRDPYAGASVPN